MAVADKGERALLELEGLRVGERTLSSPAGEFALAEVLSAEHTVSRSLWVPVLLVLIGTINLAIALQTGHADMFVAAGLMMGAGVWFRLRGTRHVLLLTTAGGGKAVWVTRDAEACERAVTLVRERIGVLRPRG